MMWKPPKRPKIVHFKKGLKSKLGLFSVHFGPNLISEFCFLKWIKMTKSVIKIEKQKQKHKYKQKSNEKFDMIRPKQTNTIKQCWILTNKNENNIWFRS